jgi:hypothetical protein
LPSPPDIILGAQLFENATLPPLQYQPMSKYDKREEKKRGNLCKKKRKDEDKRE